MLENSDNTIQLREYFKIVRGRLWVIFTIFSLTVMSGYYVTQYVLPKIYTASAQIQIKPRGQMDVASATGGDKTEKPLDSYVLQSEIEIMQTGDILLPVINDLGLDKTWARRDFKSTMPSLPPTIALDYMRKKVSIDFKRNSNILIISADSQEAKEAANIANAIIDRYKASRDAEEEKRFNSGEDAYQQYIDDQQKVVDDRKADVEKLRQQMGQEADVLMTTDAGSTTSHDEQVFEQRQRDLLNSREEADAERVLMQQVKDLSDDDFINTMIAMHQDGANITSLRTDAFKLESGIENSLKDGFDENHPKVQALRAELERTREQIKDVIAGMRRAIVVNAEMAKSRVDLLTAEVNTLKEKILKEQSGNVAPFREAQHEYEKQRSILEAYMVHLKGLKVDHTQMESPVRAVQRANVPDRPSKPNVTLNMAISVMAGLFFGIVVAFLIEYLDTSIKTMADAEQLLGLPVLTVIPNKGGPIPINEQAARLPHAEGYRILRAKLDLKVENGIGPALSVLSGGPGEGKSTTIYNLAVVCAQAGQSVILVDCDLRRPTIHDLLGASNDRGLANYLRGEGDAVEFIQRTSLPTLHVLTAGDMPISEIGALAGDKIRHMLDDLKQRYDLVLIDSPPVLGISDGSIIAREVDYVILVIQHRRYPREISLRAKRAIEEVHGNCIGMVLNSVAIKSDDSYYYYSNYGNYYKKADRNKSKKQAASSSGRSKPVLTSSRQKDIDSDEF